MGITHFILLRLGDYKSDIVIRHVISCPQVRHPAGIIVFIRGMV